MSASNLKQVAREAKVSLATASRVLSGSDYPVSSDLRTRVLAVADALDYVPNAHARALIQGDTRTIGMLVGEVGDPYFDAMINGAHRVATEESCLITIVSTGRDPQRELDSFRLLQSRGASTIIVAGSGLNDADYQTALGARIRRFRGTTVLMGRHDIEADAHVVRVEADNVDAGRLLGQHLRELGHRRVAVLGGRADVTSTGDRIRGLVEGLGTAPEVVQVEPTRDGGYAATGTLLARNSGVSAIVGTADQMAIGALSWCADNGVEVPAELSVCGCNDIWVGRDLRPSLTTVRIPLAEMGAAAVRLALFGEEAEDRHVNLPVELVVRGSTGPARLGTR